MGMDVIHAYTRPRKRKDADCATCRFSEVINTISSGEALLCRQRMYDDKTLKCYLPKEENTDENS